MLSSKILYTDSYHIYLLAYMNLCSLSGLNKQLHQPAVIVIVFDHKRQGFYTHFCFNLGLNAMMFTFQFHFRCANRQQLSTIIMNTFYAALIQLSAYCDVEL